MTLQKKAIALGARLKDCRNITTLGVRPNFSDYSEEEAGLIRNAKTIYYPTSFYADLFNAMGINTFPCYHTYMYAQDKIKQTTMFDLLNIPHPKTRNFFGKNQKKKILDFFDFPFVAKAPRGSAMGRDVFLIKNQEELDSYCRIPGPAYIQDFLESERDIRVVIIGEKPVLSYWRISKDGEFRSNVAAGASISLDDVPEQAVKLAQRAAKACMWNDVGIDILMHDSDFYVLEANMRYGRKGFKEAGIDYIKMMEEMIERGEI